MELAGEVDELLLAPHSVGMVLQNRLRLAGGEHRAGDEITQSHAGVRQCDVRLQMMPVNHGMQVCEVGAGQHQVGTGDRRVARGRFDDRAGGGDEHERRHVLQLVVPQELTGLPCEAQRSIRLIIGAQHEG